MDEVQDNFAEWKKSVKSCILYDFIYIKFKEMQNNTQGHETCFLGN